MQLSLQSVMNKAENRIAKYLRMTAVIYWKKKGIVKQKKSIKSHASTKTKGVNLSTKVWNSTRT